MLGLIVWLLVVGLIAGAIARLVVPGTQNLSIGATILIGIIGSFVGGFIGYALFRNGDSFVQPSGWIGSIVGAIIVLVVYLKFSGDRGRAIRH